jgi:hypothetical protein
MSELAGSTAHAAMAGANEAIDILVDTLVPIGAGIAGFLVGNQTLGGAQTFANLAYNAGMGLSGATANRIGGGVAAVIFASAGYAFWSLRTRGGLPFKLLGGLAGGFLLGAAAQDAVFGLILAHQPASSGLIDSIFASTQDVVTGH